MRILIANPDTIGDLVLRQPMIAALIGAGHELMLLVRPSVAALARMIAPGAHVVEYPAEPYALSAEGPWEPMEPAFAAAARFGPALLVVAPYRWTLAEEKLAERLPAVPRVGMSGNLYRGDPYAGAAPVSSMVLDQVAHVNEDDLEIVKNATLTGLILGHPVSLPDPKLVPSDAALAEARRLLAEVGLAPHEYWAACVGGTAHVALKTWPAERWAGALSHWASRYDRKFLFIGLPAERPAVDAVRAAMGPDLANANTATLMRPDISLQTLTALIALSLGYTGHDTGPMHVAAATGRAVLAVFGGGTWLRFLPAVEPSVAITVGAPCAGCGWVCTFHESYCIKSVPVDDVMRAVDDMESGLILGRQSRVIEPTPALMARFVRESARAAEERLREAVEARKQANAIATEVATPVEPVKTVEPAPASTGVATSAAMSTVSTNELIEQVCAPLRQQLDGFQKEVAALRNELEMRLPVRAAGAARRAAPRRPWRQVIADLVVGKPHLPPPATAQPLPPVSIVIPTAGADATAVAASVGSVVAQPYDNLEVVVVDDLRSPEISEYARNAGPRVRVLPMKDAATFDQVAYGFEQAYGEVMAFLRPGVTYAPGLICRVGQLFHDRRYVKATYFETVLADGALLHNLGPTRQVDTIDFLADEPVVYDGLFWRRTAYFMVGPMKPGLGAAADWDLATRTTRMFGLWRGQGAGAVVTAVPATTAERQAALAEARRLFMASFGALGRARCELIHWLNGLNERLEARLGLSRPTFSPAASERSPETVTTLPPIAAPACPLTRHPADTLLFSEPTPAGDAVCVYYASACDAAVVAGPVGRPSAERAAKHVTDTLRQFVLNEANPYPQTLLDLSGGGGTSRVAEFLRGSTTRRAVVVAADDDASQAGVTADGKVSVIVGDPMDAPLLVPEGQTFDVVLLGRAMQYAPDPLALLRRAHNLLNPGGVIAITADNVHAHALAKAGRAWNGWNLAENRTVFSPASLRRFARAANLRVRTLRTCTYGRGGSWLADLAGRGDVIHAVLGEQTS